MIEIIITLLLTFGINLDQDAITVVDERTGIVYGVGNSTSGGGRIDSDSKTFILCQDEDGKYYLIPK